MPLEKTQQGERKHCKEREKYCLAFKPVVLKGDRKREVKERVERRTL